MLPCMHRQLIATYIDMLQFYIRTDYGLICFVHKAISLRCKNTGYFNGALYYIITIKILELSWPFCWYLKGIMKRPLRLKHIVSAVRPAQVIRDNNKRT